MSDDRTLKQKVGRLFMFGFQGTEPSEPSRRFLEEWGIGGTIVFTRNAADGESMRKLVQGNEAVFRGAVAAGASYYAGYPISPSTEILNIASAYAAAHHKEFRFLQAEDEIASANAVIGASLAGAKAFTVGSS